MSRRLLGIVVAGLALAVAAESATYLPEEPWPAAADATVGLVFIGLGVVAWQRRPSSRSGLLMVATGVAWFAGSFAGAALFLHRGPLVHLLVGYPRGRLRSRLERAVVAAAYLDGAIDPLARQDAATIVLAVAVLATALIGWRRAGGAERRARAAALAAASAVAAVLGMGAVGRVAELGADAAWLWAYQAVLVLVAVGLFADLLWGRWTQAAIIGLVVDLGELEQGGTLRAKLASTVRRWRSGWTPATRSSTTTPSPPATPVRTSRAPTRSITRSRAIGSPSRWSVRAHAIPPSWWPGRRRRSTGPAEMQRRAGHRPRTSAMIPMPD